MGKFDRNYVLTIEPFQKRGEPIVITPPITIEFNVERTLLASVNVLNIRLYNLNQRTRENLRKDKLDRLTIRKLEFKAGYGDQLYTIAKGAIVSAKSVRQGSEFITTISAFDGGTAIANSKTNVSFSKGTTSKTKVNSLIKNLKEFGVEKGTVVLDQLPKTSSVRAETFSGNTVQLLDEFTNGSFYIDNGRAYVLPDDTAFLGKAILISSETGLLETPERESLHTKVKMLFTPEAKMGDLANIISRETTFTDNKTKIIGISHSGIISEAVGGKAITALNLLSGTRSLVRRIEGGL